MRRIVEVVDHGILEPESEIDRAHPVVYTYETEFRFDDGLILRVRTTLARFIGRAEDRAENERRHLAMLGVDDCEVMRFMEAA